MVRGDEPVSSARPAVLVSLEVVGQDRPGIVRKSRGAERAKHQRGRAGDRMCQRADVRRSVVPARAKISVPANVALDKLRQTLENGLAGLTVELERIK